MKLFIRPMALSHAASRQAFAVVSISVVICQLSVVSLSNCIYCESGQYISLTNKIFLVIKQYFLYVITNSFS